jgi:hypothetical protein
MLGSRKCNSIHTRLRHHCSSLGADLSRANIVNGKNDLENISRRHLGILYFKKILRL